MRKHSYPYNPKEDNKMGFLDTMLMVIVFYIFYSIGTRGIRGTQEHIDDMLESLAEALYNSYTKIRKSK